MWKSHKISSISAPHLFVRLAQASKIITYNDLSWFIMIYWYIYLLIYWSTDLIYLSVCLCLSISIYRHLREFSQGEPGEPLAPMPIQLVRSTFSTALMAALRLTTSANVAISAELPGGGWNFPSLWGLLWDTISSCGLGMGIAMYIQHQLECEPSTMATPAPTSYLELHPTSNLCGNWSETTIRGQYQPFHLGQLVQWLLN